MASGGTGDSFYIRAHFDYEQTEHGEMNFRRGDVFHVSDTLFGGVVGSYFATKIGHNNVEVKQGIIPNNNRWFCREMATAILVREFNQHFLWQSRATGHELSVERQQRR